MTVSLAQGGEGLGACWGEEKARELLREAGFSSVEVSQIDSDPLNAITLVDPSTLTVQPMSERFSIPRSLRIVPHRREGVALPESMPQNAAALRDVTASHDFD